MSSLILPPTDALAAAAAELADKARQHGERARENAVNKAMVQLHHGCAPIATVGGFFVESRTSPGVVYRVSTVHGCGCAAGVKGTPCWHQALIEVIEQANSRRVTMPERITAARARVSAEQAERDMAELFNL